MKIVTIADNRPDFIQIQLDSIKKHVKDDYEYVVYDSSDSDLVRQKCTELEVECIKIENKGNWPSIPSWTVSCILNEMWSDLFLEEDILVIMDSDMFFIRDINIRDTMKDHDWAFVPQFRKDGALCYPWTGFMIFDMKTLPKKYDIAWDTVENEVPHLDVGGVNYKYLDQNAVRRLYLDMWTVIDSGIYSFNGIDTTDINPNHLALEKKVEGFPKPLYVDLIGIKGASFEECFIFHYKSGSNYQGFMTKEYNELKTCALTKLL